MNLCFNNELSQIITLIVHIDTSQRNHIKDLNILIGNSAMNFKGGITGGAYQINEISIIVLKALNELEELVKSDIE